ncbi:MAG: OB-fold nucleic acid binding domain-containing protein [Candidatus Nanohaloarchaea archaeon]|nr:OB-fold nucleic acid binding domain-containing protein [Candidatus Nanohaloarchaea archaeon]
MDIEELEPGQDDFELEATVKKIHRPRAVSTKYGQKLLTTAVLEDTTGEIETVLWEEQIDDLEEGDDVRVEGCYVRQWVDHLQLNIPRSGEIEQV